MDEQTRGNEMPRGNNEMPRSTLRKFMNDPKTSVMSYLAENMATQQIQQHLNQQNNAPNAPQQNNTAYGQQYPNQGSNGLSNQFQNHSNASQTSLTPSQAAQNNGNFQSAASQIAQTPNSQLSSMAPYVASNVGSLLHQSSEGQSGEDSINGRFQQQGSNPLTQQQTGQIQKTEISLKNLGKPPPTSGMKHNSSPQSAPRLYHRMNLDFEVAKSSFFTARAQHNSQEMTSAAYDLESLSRRIWSLRFEHAWEFDSYEETGHQAVVAHWQSQYELWADTVLDIQEGDSAASMFAVHRSSSTGPAAMAVSAMAGNPSISPMVPQLGMTGQPPSFDHTQQPSYQEMDLNPAHQLNVQPQQVFANQNPLVDQRLPTNQGVQNTPPQQYPPQGGLPGGFPVSSPQPVGGNLVQQSLPSLQNQSMTPPQQAGMGQGQVGQMQGQNRPPPSNIQGGPPMMGAGPQNNNQGMAPNNQPNMQRGPFQQGPPQQGGQPMQGGPPPNVQQQQPPYAPYTAQRPPTRPDSANMPPQGPMSQMSLGQNQPSRPEGFMPPGPQAGGR